MFEIAVKHTEPEVVAFIDMHGPYAQIPEGYHKLYEWIEHQGMKPIGMPHAVYLTDPRKVQESEATWELQAPVAGEMPDRKPDHRGFGTKHLESELVAFALHKGPYESVELTYDRLMEWVNRNGYEICGPPEEIYLTDPDDAPPTDYLTEVRFPVTRRD